MLAAGIVEYAEHFSDTAADLRAVVYILGGFTMVVAAPIIPLRAGRAKELGLYARVYDLGTRPFSLEEKGRLVRDLEKAVADVEKKLSSRRLVLIGCEVSLVVVAMVPCAKYRDPVAAALVLILAAIAWTCQVKLRRWSLRGELTKLKQFQTRITQMAALPAPPAERKKLWRRLLYCGHRGRRGEPASGPGEQADGGRPFDPGQ